MMEAEQWPEGLKKTESRRRVLEALRQAERPVQALELYRSLAQTGQEVPLSTVYRALSAFEAAGIVEKSVLGEESARVYRLKGGHEHYAVCLKCHRKIPLRACPLAWKAEDLSEDAFVVTDHRLELYGYCKACREGKERTQ